MLWMNEIDLFIDIDELQVALNLLGPHITVEFPPYDTTLLEARQHAEGYRLTKIASALDIDARFRSFSHPEFFSFQDIVQCFLSSGFSPYSNLDDIKEIIQVKKQALSSFKELFYVLDTNLFYDRFVSTYDVIPAPHVFLVDTVQKEILHHLNNKFDQSHLLDSLKSLVLEHSSMAETMVDQVYKEMVNRNMKSTRIARHMALEEYTFVRKYGKEIPTDKENAETSRENDQIIVESIKQFQQKSQYNEFLLLTADANMKDVCDMVGVDSLILRKPTDIETKLCSTQQFLRLVYHLCVLTGFLKINSTLLFSEYQGGNQEYPLKLRLLNQTDYDTVKKHVGLCRKLQEIEKEES